MLSKKMLTRAKLPFLMQIVRLSYGGGLSVSASSLFTRHKSRNKFLWESLLCHSVSLISFDDEEAERAIRHEYVHP